MRYIPAIAVTQTFQNLFDYSSWRGKFDPGVAAVLAFKEASSAFFCLFDTYLPSTLCLRGSANMVRGPKKHLKRLNGKRPPRLGI